MSVRLSELVSELGRNGVNGPRHFKNPSLQGRGTLIARGAQFEVFEDNVGPQDIVIKRVRRYDEGVDMAPPNIQSHFLTVQREIASLCEPIRRSNRNIVKLLAWGFDYPTSDLSYRLPVLCMEKALCSLTTFLDPSNRERHCVDTRYHLSLDIASGLGAVHATGLAHCDLKPDNVLIFPNDCPKVPFLAKLSDFGHCIVLDTNIRSFSAYKGSPGWLPPEVAERDFLLSGAFRSDLLTKSDSYTYGLLVLSIFLYHGQKVPCQETLWKDKFLSVVLEEARIQMIEGHTLECTRRVVGTLLKRQPCDRREITPDLLNCDEQGFHIWFIIALILNC